MRPSATFASCLVLTFVLTGSPAAALDPRYNLEFGWPEYIVHSRAVADASGVSVAASGDTVVTLWANATDGRLYSATGTVAGAHIAFGPAVTDGTVGTQTALALSAPAAAPPASPTLKTRSVLVDPCHPSSSSSSSSGGGSKTPSRGGSPQRGGGSLLCTGSSSSISSSAPVAVRAYGMFVSAGTVYLRCGTLPAASAAEAGAAAGAATTVAWGDPIVVATGGADSPAVASWGQHVIISWVGSNGTAQYRSLWDAGGTAAGLQTLSSGSLGPASTVSVAMNAATAVWAFVDAQGLAHYRVAAVSRKGCPKAKVALSLQADAPLGATAVARGIAVALLRGGRPDVVIFTYTPADRSLGWRPRTAVASLRGAALVLQWLTPFGGAMLGPLCQSAALAVTDGNLPILCVADAAPVLAGVGCSTSLFRDRSAWMQTLLDSGQWDDAITLRNVSIPGSHDSGTYNNKDFLGVQFVQTQGLSIYGQLNVGTRYFDVRPMYLHQNQSYYTQHGSVPGVPMATVFNDILTFLEQDQRRELVVVKLSHYVAFNGVASVEAMLQATLPPALLTLMVTRGQLAGRRVAETRLQELLAATGRLLLVAGEDAILPPLPYLLTYLDCQSPGPSSDQCGLEPPGGELTAYDSYADQSAASAVVADQAIKYASFNGLSGLDFYENGTCTGAQCDLEFLSWQATQTGQTIAFSVRTLAAQLLSQLAGTLAAPPFSTRALLANGQAKVVNVIYTDFVEGARGVDMALWAMFPGQQALPVAVGG